jgi:type I restriction enzyme, S subunit
MRFESFKNARVVRSSWLEEGGRRLDCNPYMSGALEARDALKKLKVHKEPLKSLTAGYAGGIYNGPMFRRNYVESQEHGVPFITSGPMLLADLSTLPLLRKKDAQSSRLSYLRLQPGTTLISCSGTIGRMTYVRPDMADIWSSQDVLKVVPDESKIPPGYLYAFLSSKYGVPLVVSGTYGAIIQHIEPEHIADLPIPRLSAAVESQIHDFISQAAEKRTAATLKLQCAQQFLSASIGTPAQPGTHMTYIDRLTQVIRFSDIEKSMRLEGFFYNPTAARIDNWARSFGEQCVDLGSIADVYDVPPFKHIYVQSGYGIPFFTSGELFELSRTASKYLSNTRTKNLHRYILQRDWVLLARSGQLGGIIGRPQYADSALAGAAASDHVIRLVPKGVPGGYLFAYLYASHIGYPLLTRTMTGHSIPALWPSQLKSLPVVLTTTDKMTAISDLVLTAFEHRVEATALENQAREIVEVAIGGSN